MCLTNRLHSLWVEAASDRRQLSVWPSGLRRCVQVAVHFCGREFESHSWQTKLLPPGHNKNETPYQLDIQPKHHMDSRVAQWKRAGPITQRSVDRNYALLKPNSFLLFCSLFFISDVNRDHKCVPAPQHDPLAQRIARWTSNPKVLGSIPRWVANCFASQ